MSLIDKILIALGLKKKPEPVADTWATPAVTVVDTPLPGAGSQPTPAPAPEPVSEPAPAEALPGAGSAWPFPGDKPGAAAMTPAPKKRGRPAKAK